MSDRSIALGDRMKMYEGIESDRILVPLCPVIARMDGRAFHSFTRDMERPFDAKLRGWMLATTIALVKETNACMGYTQSDEITLAWHQADLRSELWFGGRVQKMVSQLASWTTLEFNALLPPEYARRKPTFDARVWSVPSRMEGANAFLWRELDATKNSITMAAQAVFSHKQLHGKNGNEKQAMLYEKGINWNDYPACFKRGTYVQRRKVIRRFSADEIAVLPEKHAARTNPGLMVERHDVSEITLDPLNTIRNAADVIFDGAEPVSAMGGRTVSQ